MKEKTKPPTAGDVAQKEFLKCIRRIHGKDLSPEDEAFYASAARCEPDKIAEYLAAVKDGQGPDPAYAERFHSMRPDFGKRRVVRKAIDDGPEPSWDNVVREIEDQDGPSR